MLAVQAFVVSAALALLIAELLKALGTDEDPLLMAIILVATSLGVLVPVLKDTGEIQSEFGQLIFIAGSIAEFGSILLLSLFFSKESSSPAASITLLCGFGIVIGLGSFLVGRAWRTRWLARQMERLDESSSQLRVRAAVAIMFAFVAMANHLGLEAILGSFLAGALIRVVDRGNVIAGEHLRSKLEAIGFGFVVPFFFVTTGLTLDMKALFSSWTAGREILEFFLALLAVRGLPALLYRARFGARRAYVAGLMQATSLTFIVVAAHPGARSGTGGRMSYERGPVEVAEDVFAYLQPDGSWGWSNAGLVRGDDGSLLVDTLFDLRLTRQMLEELQPLAARIDTVVNTHANGDHCWGNELVDGARIVASRACAEEMGRLSPDVLVGMVKAAPTTGRLGEFAARIFGPFEFEGITLTTPTETFDGSLTLHVGDTAVELLEVGPAHTDGDVVVHLPAEKVVFTGDILFNGGHPIVWAGPVGNWTAALDRILALDPDVVVPGHGPVTTKEAVEAERDYFGWLAREARLCFEAGLSPLEAARDLRGEYDSWSEGERLVVNVAAVYRELDPGSSSPAVLELFEQMAELAAVS
jgi:Kef-type K+ transport system membrane component KefB